MNIFDFFTALGAFYTSTWFLVCGFGFDSMPPTMFHQSLGHSLQKYNRKLDAVRHSVGKHSCLLMK